MADQNMIVTGRQQIAGGGVKLTGTAIAPSTLNNVTARRATSAPPAADKATGTFVANAADVKLGQTIWNDVTTRNLTFKLTLKHTNGVVSDVDAMPAPQAAATAAGAE